MAAGGGRSIGRGLEGWGLGGGGCRAVLKFGFVSLMLGQPLLDRKAVFENCCQFELLNYLDDSPVLRKGFDAGLSFLKSPDYVHHKSCKGFQHDLGLGYVILTLQIEYHNFILAAKIACQVICRGTTLLAFHVKREDGFLDLPDPAQLRQRCPTCLKPLPGLRKQA